MNKIFLTLALSFTIMCFSQEIKLDKGKYYVNGSQISTRETKKLLFTNFHLLRILVTNHYKIFLYFI